MSGSCTVSPRWQPQCSCVIESSFAPGERLQAPGSLWFFLPLSCNFRFELRLSIFWYFLKKNGFWHKTGPPYGNVWICLWYTCTLSYSVVCHQLLNTVQRSLVDCVKFSVLVNHGVRPSCSLGGSTYPQKNKNKQTNKTKLGTHHIMYHFCSMRLGFVVSRYLLGTLEDSHCFL